MVTDKEIKDAEKEAEAESEDELETESDASKQPEQTPFADVIAAQKSENRAEKKLEKLKEKQDKQLLELGQSEVEIGKQEAIEQQLEEQRESEFDKEMKRQTRIGRQGKYDPIALREETKQKQKKEARPAKQVKSETISSPVIITSAKGSALIKSARTLQDRREAEELAIEENEKKEFERMQRDPFTRTINREEEIKKDEEIAEKLYQEKLKESRERAEQLQSKVEVEEAQETKQESNEELKQIDEREKQIAKLEIIATKSKDISELDALTAERAELETRRQSVILSREKEEIADEDLELKALDERIKLENLERQRLGLEPALTTAQQKAALAEEKLTQNQLRLKRNRERKEETEQLLLEARRTRNEASVQKLEKEQIDLKRKELKLQDDIRKDNVNKIKSTEKFQKLQQKKEKLQLKADVTRLRAQKKVQERVIQDKRRELLQKNLAFIATRGAIRIGAKAIQNAREAHRPGADRMLIGTPEGTPVEQVIGDSTVAEVEPEFDLIDELAGEQFGGKNDKVGKRLRLI